MSLVEFFPPFSATLPCTRYFEIDSERVGSRFAVWVTIPTKYGIDTDRYYPAIYTLDGNVTVPQTALFHMLEFDPIYPIRRVRSYRSRLCRRRRAPSTRRSGARPNPPR
jgi:predicted alpha/beta superfamily hydrolase